MKNKNYANIILLLLFFVVWGHHFNHFLNKYIFSFHVPLIFFVTGLVFNNSSLKDVNFSFFLKAKLKEIILPYFIYSIVLYGIWFVIVYLTGKAVVEGLDPVRNLIGIFYSQGMNEYMDWGLHMWVFPCIFIIEIIYYWIVKIKNRTFGFWGIIFALLILGLNLNNLFDFSLPWSLDIAFVGLFFFVMGDIMKSVTLKKKIFINVLLLIVLFSVGYVLQYLNVRIDLKNQDFGNPFLFILASTSSIIFYYLLLTSLNEIKLRTLVVSCAIPVYVFHLRAWTFILQAVRFVFPILLNLNSNIMTFLFSVFQIILIIGIIFLYRKVIQKK